MCAYYQATRPTGGGATCAYYQARHSNVLYFPFGFSLVHDITIDARFISYRTKR